MNKVKFSYHNRCRGKPFKDSTGKLWINEERINLGYGWNSVELDFDELFIMLSQGGYAVAPYLKTDHRDENNFECHSFALVDIDDGMRIEDLDNFLFYQAFGSGYYTSPSHTEENHRFRLIYRFEHQITTAQDMRLIYESLLAVHGAADISCKDSARLFYGTIDAARSEITDRVLTSDGIEYALEEREKKLATQVVSIPQKQYVPKTKTEQEKFDEVKKHLDELSRCYQDLTYNIRFSISRAVASEIGVANTIVEMRSRWPDTEKTAKYEQILKDPLKPDGPGIGSVIHMIRQVNPTYLKIEANPVKMIRNAFNPKIRNTLF